VHYAKIVVALKETLRLMDETPKARSGLVGAVPTDWQDRDQGHQSLRRRGAESA